MNMRAIHKAMLASIDLSIEAYLMLELVFGNIKMKHLK